jgi:hypothetical protein
MGKVFVKGPVESPHDLLAKESRLGQAGRIGLDATQAAVNLTRPQSIQSFADLAGIPFNIARYFMEGKVKRQLSPTEQAYQKLLANRQAQEQFGQEEKVRQRDEERAENFRLLEGLAANDDRLIQPLPEVTGSRFSRAGRQQRKDSKQALADAQAERKEMYEKLEAAQRLPLQEQAELNRIAAVKEKARRDVEAEDYRRGLRGQKQRGGEAVHGKAEELATASDAAEQVNVGGDGLAPMPAGLRNQIDTQDMATMGGERPLATQPQISPADNAASVAASGGVNSSPHGAKEEDKRDDAMATNSENIDFDNETGVERPKQEDNAGEVPNFGAAPPLPTDVSNQANIGDNFGLNADDLANIVEEQERRMRGEG